MSYSHIATNGTTQLSAVNGVVLRSVVVGTAGSGGNTLQLIEGTIAQIGSAPVIANIATDISGTYYFSTPVNGLSAVLGTGTVGDLTVTYQ
jgi:hypothetical protein